MIAVRFNNVEEFCGELEQIASAKHGDVLRVCVLHQKDPHYPLHMLTVLAGVVNDCGHIVELQKYCGQVASWELVGQDQAAVKYANETAAEVRKRGAELGFEVRDGRYLQAEELCK